jgi:replicative DNA helicase
MSTTGESPEPTDQLGEADERLHAGDFTEDPRLDSEALCLCAVLWSTPAAAGQVVGVLDATDFVRAEHAALFGVIADEVTHRRPHDPASIAAVITHRGSGSHHAALLTGALAAATTAGATPESARHHAINVATAAYRRSFHTAAAAMTQAAEQLPTADLFDHLVDVGRAQRTATERLARLRTTLDNPCTR